MVYLTDKMSTVHQKVLVEIHNVEGLAAFQHRWLRFWKQSTIKDSVYLHEYTLLVCQLIFVEFHNETIIHLHCNYFTKHHMDKEDFQSDNVESNKAAYIK